MRKFWETHVTPEAQEKELNGEFISQELIDKMAEANILAMRMGTYADNQNVLRHLITGLAAAQTAAGLVASRRLQTFGRDFHVC